MAKWEKVKLGDICAFCGKGQHPASFANEYGEYRFIVSGLKEKKCSEYDSDDEVFIIGDGGCANIHYIKGKYSASDHTYIFKSKNSTILTKYIYVYLKFNIHLLAKGFKGAGIKNLSKSYILSIEIPVIPLDIQLQIIDRLDAVSDLLEKQKQLLAEQDNLIKSIFYDMFGDTKTNSKKWELVRLEDVLSIGSSTRVFVDELVSEGIPFYRGTEIGAMAVGEKIIPSLFITSEHYKKLCSRSGRPSIGDLLMPSICPDGRIWQVQIESPFYFKDGRVLWIHFPSHNIFTSMYLRYAMKEKFAVDYHNIASGTTFAELKICALKSLKIMCPPIELQQKFATIVEGIEAQKEKIKLSIAETQTLFASLMAKYFDEE